MRIPAMTPEPKHPPIVPSYGVATLADLSASILASVEQESPDAGDPVGGSARPRNVLGLQPARRACLLIVDGLGWELLRDHPAVAPFLSELARNSKPITAGFPASTATSLGSIGTGCPPGQHGLLGYQVMIPGQDRLLTALRWGPRVIPRQRPDRGGHARRGFLARRHDGRPRRADRGRALFPRPRVRGGIPRRSRRDRAHVRRRLGCLVLPAGPRGQAGRTARSFAAIGNLPLRDGGSRHGGC